MSALIPFDANSSLPAHIAAAFGTSENEFGYSSGGASFPVVSLKGKVFTIKRGDEKTLITKPGEDDVPASHIEVVILDSAPKGAKNARTFYANGFTEGSTGAPDCSSDDGEVPNADAKEKQASKCALCPQNAVGSGATMQNPKAKACKSSKLLAVAPAGQLNDPMLLRVPGDSLSKLSEYGDFLGKRKVKAAGVVTRIGFDYSVAHPKLTFKATNFVTPEMAAEIMAMRESDTVKAMLGDKSIAKSAVDGEHDEIAPAPVQAPKAVAAKPAAKPIPAPAPAMAASDDDDLPTEPPKAKVKVEGEEAPKPAPKKAAPKAAEVSGDIDSALDDLDFDD